MKERSDHLPHAHLVLSACSSLDHITKSDRMFLSLSVILVSVHYTVVVNMCLLYVKFFKFFNVNQEAISKKILKVY